jgi:hypothetical protein
MMDLMEVTMKIVPFAHSFGILSCVTNLLLDLMARAMKVSPYSWIVVTMYSLERA